MSRDIKTTKIDKKLGTISIVVSIDNDKKNIEITDSNDEAENFRAMCRELKKIEDELSLKSKQKG